MCLKQMRGCAEALITYRASLSEVHVTSVHFALLYEYESASAAKGTAASADNCALSLPGLSTAACRDKACRSWQHPRSCPDNLSRLNL